MTGERKSTKTSCRGCEQVREAEGRKTKPLFLKMTQKKILSQKSSKATNQKIGLEIINHFKKPDKEMFMKFIYLKIIKTDSAQGSSNRCKN